MRWSLDPHGAVSHVSKDWRSFCGVQDDDIVGTCSRFLVHPDDRPEISSIISHSVHLGEPFLIVFRLKRADEKYAWVMAGASPALSPADGDLLGYLGDTEVLKAAPTSPVALNILHGMPRGSRQKIVMLDAMADHITTARNIAKYTDDVSLKKILNFALLSIGDQIYKALKT